MTTVALRLGLASLLLAPGFCGCATNSFEQAERLQPGVLIEAPINPKGLALVPVQFMGKEYRFVLDTGCSRTVVDLSLRGKLGRPKDSWKAETPGGSLDIEVFAAPEAKIGPIPLNRLSSIGAVDLRSFRTLYGDDVRGILGMDVLRDFVVRLDFDRGMLSIEKAGKTVAPDLEEAVEISYDKGVPFLHARVMGLGDVNFEIDTGSMFSGGLHQAYLDSLPEAGRRATMPAMAGTVAGTQHAAMMRVPTVTVGSSSYQELVMITDGLASRLGWGFLSRHNVVLDFPNHKAYLHKGMQFNRRDGGGYCGLFFRAVEGKLLVTVDPEGPAARGGLEDGDEVLAVDGCERDHLAEQVVALGDGSVDPGRQVTLTVRRRGQMRTIRFVVRSGI